MSKSFLASKTIWLCLLSPLFGWLASKYGFDVPPETQQAVAEALGGLAAVIVANRFATKQPIHLIAPKEVTTSKPEKDISK